MRTRCRILFLAAAAVLGCGCAFSQTPNSYTPLTATNVKVGGQAVTGYLAVTPVSGGGTTKGAAIPLVTAGGESLLPGGYYGTLTAGNMVGALSIPDQCTTSTLDPTATYDLLVQISGTQTLPDGTTKPVSAQYTIPRASNFACGAASVALGSFRPTQITPVLPSGVVTQATMPTACTGAGVWYGSVPTANTVPAAGCVNGVFVPFAGGVAVASSTAVTALTCGGALAIPFPASGSVVFYRITTTANCTVSFTNTPANGTGSETRVLFLPTTYTVTFPASGSSLVWVGGTPPSAPTSAAYSTFHLTAYGPLVVGKD